MATDLNVTVKTLLYASCNSVQRSVPQVRSNDVERQKYQAFVQLVYLCEHLPDDHCTRSGTKRSSFSVLSVFKNVVIHSAKGQLLTSTYLNQSLCLSAF